MDTHHATFLCKHEYTPHIKRLFFEEIQDVHTYLRNTVEKGIYY